MYYGWYVVMMAAAVYAVLMGATFNAFGLFVVPVSADLGLSRADINSGLILLNMGGALLAPVIGRMLDRIPARRIMIGSALIGGAGFALLSFSTAMWLSAIAMGVLLAAVVQGGGMLTMSMLLARWFTVHRGRAMILAMLGASLGSIIIAPAIGWSIEHEGWRATLLIMGTVVTVLIIVLALVVREQPRPGELEAAPTTYDAVTGVADIPAPPLAPASVASLLRMPQFWTIGISSSIAMGMMQTIIITIVPLAIEAGLTTVQAAGLISITGAAAVISKLVLAVVADRFDRILMLAVLFALGVIVSILLLLGAGYPLLITCAVMLGISSSAAAPIFYALLADRFGIASFGTLRGLMAFLIAVASAVAVRFAGEVFDRLKNYDFIFYTFIALGVFSVALMLSTWLTRSADETNTIQAGRTKEE